MKSPENVRVTEEARQEGGAQGHSPAGGPGLLRGACALSPGTG